MPDSVLPTHEAILRLCAAAAPVPWHPRAYALESGVPREALDSLLNELRLAGLLQLTEWVKSQGQGYKLTDFAEDLLKNPVALAQFRFGLQGKKSPVEPASPIKNDDHTPNTFERGEAARQALYFPEPPRLVPALILINVLMFVVSLYVAVRADITFNQFISRGNGEVLHRLGALSPIDLIHGEWWRLLTCCFLHFGLMHLLLNMYCLYALGILESLWGRSRFLLLYIASGIGGSCAAMLFYSPSDRGMVLAGASGAIWGLMASLVAWLFMNRSHLTPRERTSWIQALSLTFIINIVVSFLPGISAGAHFGGGVVGFIMGTLLHVQRYAPAPRRQFAAILTALLPILCVVAVMEKVKHDERWLLLADQERKDKQKFARGEFRQNVLLAIDQVDAVHAAIAANAFLLAEKTPADRKSDKRLPLLLQQLTTARGLVKAALAKVPEAPYSDEKLEEARRAGLEHLQAIDEMLQKYEQLTQSDTVSDNAELEALYARIVKINATWQAIRGQF